MPPFPTLVQRLRHTLLPGSCHLCGCRVDGDIDLCPDCREGLLGISRACQACGVPLPADSVGNVICGRCQIRPPAFDRCEAALQFVYPLDHLVRRFKFDRDLSVGRTLSLLMAKHFDGLENPPALLIPVPLHEKRLRQRGFNQAALLALALGKVNGIAVTENSVRRVNDTAVQSGLDARRRRRNVAAAFECVSRDLPDHVALIDDVSTTGSTLNELAATVKRAGVTRVDCYLLARTPWDG